MITQNEINIAKHCISYAMEHGADAVRVSVNDSTTDSCTLLNGVMDKVTHAADRSIYLYIFADSRYGTFSTNRLDIHDLEKFIIQSAKILGILPQLPENKKSGKDVLEYVFTQVVRWKKG